MRRVPDEMVDRGLSRLLLDNIAGFATWLYACEPARRGDLTEEFRRTDQNASSRMGHTWDDPGSRRTNYIIGPGQADRAALSCNGR